MNQKMLDALEICLQRMQQGEPLDSVLALYPQMVAQLRPLLDIAARARSARVESLPTTILAHQLARGLALAADRRQGSKHSFTPGHAWRPVMTVLSVIALLVMSSNGLLIASAHSIPGDTLYPLKRSVESTQLHLVLDPEKKITLEHTFDERRVDETRTLISHQRVESVGFSGEVSSQSKTEWLVSGIPVFITILTEVEDGILVGDDVVVFGETNTSGGVDAARLTLAPKPAAQPILPAAPNETPSAESSVESDGHDTSIESSISRPSSSGGDEQKIIEKNRQSSTKSNEQQPPSATSLISLSKSETHRVLQNNGHD